MAGPVHHNENSPTIENGENHLKIGIPIETRATAIYTDLGSIEDMPRTVSICPNRKCVAFGCRMGIELHWVDALTGGDLNRWFPLAAPSDYLYFLPQRPGIDSRKKLRLISSAAGPATLPLLRSDSSPTRWKYWPTTTAYGRRQSLTRLFFGKLPFPGAAVPSSPEPSTQTQSDEIQGVLRTVDCDHFRAVPLSDGSHLLFTDPTSGCLCVGSDAPLGGPTKLIRKLTFAPPNQQKGWQSSPVRYKAGKALQWGLRIVAAYIDGNVVLYNVARDLFSHIQGMHDSTDVWDENSGVIGQSDLLMDSLMSCHPNASAEQTASTSANSTVNSPNLPIRINGVLITNVEDDFVDDLAVQTEGGGLSVWLFLRSGKARLYSIYAPVNHQKIVRYIGENGLVYDVDSNKPDDSTDEPVEKTNEEHRPAIHVKWSAYRRSW